MLEESSFGWALVAGTQNNHKPIMGYFGLGAGKTRYTRTLSQQRWGPTRHNPEQGTSVSDCLVTQGRRPCASLSWLTWPVTWMTGWQENPPLLVGGDIQYWSLTFSIKPFISFGNKSHFLALKNVQLIWTEKTLTRLSLSLRPEVGGGRCMLDKASLTW